RATRLAASPGRKNVRSGDGRARPIYFTSGQGVGGASGGDPPGLPYWIIGCERGQDRRDRHPNKLALPTTSRSLTAPVITIVVELPFRVFDVVTKENGPCDTCR